MNAAVWLIWLAAILLVAVFGQTPALRWLLMLLPFCFVASALATWLASKKLTLSVKVKEGGGKKQGARGELQVINRSYLPVMQLRCTLLLRNLLTGEETGQAVSVPVLPMSRRKVTFRIKSQHCGQVAVTFKRVAAVDFFGMTRYPLKFEAEADTIIMPNTFLMRVLPVIDSVCPEESDEYEPDRAGYDVSEVHQIRGYIPGDSVRQIHWKLTGKFDHLMVKQAGQPLKHAMLLFLDFSTSHKKKSSPACFDALAEVAVSLSQALLDAGIAHLIGWRQPDGALAHASVQNADDLTEALPEMLCAHDLGVLSEGQGSNLFENLRFSQMIWLCTAVPSIYFDTNAKMTVLCCTDSRQKDNEQGDESVVFFTPASYQKDLANLIL
ncbi:DUF58 domain-containing protein [Oscillospiraceae bacterium LTW-04]|nr:DUF58 domain-containing protein [Oscillospiraceae bacterium MB24-C1]